MYPHLQNGDLVIFRSPGSKSQLQIGTIVIYVNTNDGPSYFDTITRPIIIHRIVGKFVEDGNIYYVTKGDNNQANDSAPVLSDQIIGIPLLVVPKIGYLLLFLGSSQGLVAVTAVLMMFYLLDSEQKQNFENQKNKLLWKVSQRVLKGTLNEASLKKLELALEFASSPDAAVDPKVRNILQWLAESHEIRSIKVIADPCRECSGKVIRVRQSSNDPLIFCIDCLARYQSIDDLAVKS
jgi:signal peptidase I